MSNIIFNQNIDQYVPSSSQAVDDLLEILKEICLDDSFSASLGIDDTKIDRVAKDQIEMDALDATGNDNVDDVNIVKSVLKQHNLLQSASNSDDDEDVVEIPPVVTVKQANQAITDLINFLSLESSLPMELQSDLLSNLQRACCPLIHQQKFEKVGLLKQLTVANILLQSRKSELLRLVLKYAFVTIPFLTALDCDHDMNCTSKIHLGLLLWSNIMPILVSIYYHIRDLLNNTRIYIFLPPGEKVVGYYLFLTCLQKVSRRFKFYDVASAFSSHFVVILLLLTLPHWSKGDPNTPDLSSGTKTEVKVEVV